MILSAQLVHMTVGKIKAAKRRRHRILKANKSHAIQETISTTTSLPKPSFIKHQTIRHKASSP